MKRSMVVITSLGLSACSSITDMATGIDSSYPQTWPAISKGDNECPNLTGSYTDYGDFSYDSGSLENSLTYQILGISMVPQYVFLESSEGSVKIEVQFDDEQSETRIFSQKADEIRCKDGAVWFPPAIETGADGTGGYRAKHSFGLRIADDGNLIGEARVTSVGAIVWIIPVAGSQTIWYQWLRLPSK